MSAPPNFPVSLQPIIEQGFLEREFSQAMRSRAGYRACADRVPVSAALGETITKDRAGTGPHSAERYTLTVQLYAATTDLNVITERVGIASQFLQNAYVNGEQAVRSLDELSRNALLKAGAAIVRPEQRSTSADLTPADTLRMSTLLDAVAKLRSDEAPEIDGAYNCYLDPMSARQLFADPDFKVLFHGATSANQVFKRGMTSDFLGLRFIPTIEASVQPHPTFPGLYVRKPIIAGQGALVEGDFAGLAAADFAPSDADVRIVDGVAMVTRMATDRLTQIIAQSWYWAGGFAAPADLNAGDGPACKRHVVIEHVA